MSIYRRPPVTGAMIFFTVTLATRGGDLLVREVDLLRSRAGDQGGATLWHRGVGGLARSPPCRVADARGGQGLWRAVQEKYGTGVSACRPGCRPGFSPAMPAQPAYTYSTDLPVVRSGRYAGLKPGLRHDKRELAIWQRRFWEHHIRDEADYWAHLRYCWWNPMKHGFVARPEDWPFSSVHWDGRYRPGMDLGV